MQNLINQFHLPFNSVDTHIYTVTHATHILTQFYLNAICNNQNGMNIIDNDLTLCQTFTKPSKSKFKSQ